MTSSPTSLLPLRPVLDLCPLLALSSIYQLRSRPLRRRLPLLPSLPPLSLPQIRSQGLYRRPPRRLESTRWRFRSTPLDSRTRRTRRASVQSDRSRARSQLAPRHSEGPAAESLAERDVQAGGCYDGDGVLGRRRFCAEEEGAEEVASRSVGSGRYGCGRACRASKLPAGVAGGGVWKAGAEGERSRGGRWVGGHERAASRVHRASLAA